MIELWLSPKPAIIRPWKQVQPNIELVDFRSAGLVNFGSPYGALAGASLNNVANTSALTQTTFTFSSVALGTAVGTSLVAVNMVAVNDGNAVFRSLSTLSIDGTNGTIHVESETGAVTFSSSYASIVSRATSNTSGNIVCTFTNSMQGCAISVYRLNNLVSATPHATATAITPSGSRDTSVATTINIPNKGLLLLGVTAREQTPTLVGATGDASFFTSNVSKTASSSRMPAETARAVSASFATSTAALAGVSWS